MSADGKDRRFDAAAAERLLAGQDVGLGDLSDLLAAASAPPRPHELTGEMAAVVAFRYATLAAPGGHHRRRSTAKSSWARLAGIKVAAVAVALVTAGVALAASTGVIPSPFGVDPSTAAPDLTSGRPHDTGNTVNGSTGGAPATTHGSPSAVPSPSLDALCRAYRVKVAEDPGKALDSPAFGALITAAGGRDKVDDYCDVLLGDTPGKPTQAPGNPNHPTGPPQTPGRPTR